MLKEIKNSLIALKIGVTSVTLGNWRNSDDETKQYRLEAVTIGSTLLENGFTKDEVIWLAQYRFKPENKDLIDEINRLRARVAELEECLIDVGVVAENALGKK